jgi:hypothetical protein
MEIIVRNSVDIEGISKANLARNHFGAFDEVAVAELRVDETSLIELKRKACAGQRTRARKNLDGDLEFHSSQDTAS